MGRVAGLLLVVAGAYLVYYWARIRFGDTATVADDPIVSFGVRFSGSVRTFADGGSPAASTPASATALRDLGDIGRLRSLFNTSSKEPRLIVLVSPT